MTSLDVRNTPAAAVLYDQIVESYGSMSHLLITSRYVDKYGQLPTSWRMDPPAVKRCVKCDALVVDPQLAPQEPEVCADCGDPA